MTVRRVVRPWVSHLRGGLSAHSGPAPAPVLDSVDYEAYWLDRGVPEPTEPSPDDPWDYPRFLAIAALTHPGERVADIGCGGGSLLAFLRNRGWTDLVGVDVSETTVAALREYGYEAVAAPLETFDPAQLGHVDVAVLSEVLEHLVPFEDVLGRVAAHADRVIISHPNIGFWVHRWRLMTGRFPIQWGWHPGEHVRFFTVVDLREFLEREGYEVLSLTAPVGVPSRRLRERWPNLFADHVIVELRSRPPVLSG
ncbi:MAG TPA: methionine biosynthesis protein MetW [Dermatophilaceae bacterium]